MPAGRTAWLALPPILALVLLPGRPHVAWAVLGLDVLIVLLAVLDGLLAARAALEVERRLPSHLSVGAPNPVRLLVHNRTGRRLVLRLWDERPAALEADADVLPLRMPAWGSGAAVWRVTPPTRGRFTWGDAWIRVRGPLGLSWAERRFELAQAVKVYPDVRSVTHLLLAGGTRDLAVMGVHALRREGEGSEFETLREYQPGDSFRDVDWKATARRDAPVVRVQQPERSQTVLLCLDASRLMAVRSGALSRLDHAVNAALLLAFVALRNDDRVGLLVFADEVVSFVPPAKGRAHYRRLLEALYGVEPSRTYVDHRAFARAVLANQKRRALVLTFTDLHDEATTRPLVEQVRRIARRHVPVILAMRDPALEAAARARPLHEEDAFRMAAAAELLDEREALRRGLSSAGAHILDPLPEDAVVAAVNAYVQVKRRQLL